MANESLTYVLTMVSVLTICLIIFAFFKKAPKGLKYFDKYDGDVEFFYDRELGEDEVYIRDHTGMNIHKVEIDFTHTRYSPPTYSMPPVEGGLFIHVKRVPFKILVVGGEVEFVSKHVMRLLPQDPKKVTLWIKDA